MALAPGQINSFMRNIYSAMAALLAVVGGMGLLSPANVTTVLNAVHNIGEGVVSISTGIAAISPLFIGAYAAWTASHKSTLIAVATNPQTSPAVKQAVVTALAKTYDTVIPPTAKDV
jgi:hypothetical protein